MLIVPLQDHPSTRTYPQNSSTTLSQCLLQSLLYHVGTNSLALCSPAVYKSAWGWAYLQSSTPTLQPCEDHQMGAWARALKDLLIQRLQVSFMELGKFKVSKDGEMVTSKRWWFFDSAPAFLNIMFLNKVNGYSREIAKGHRAELDLINQINSEANTGKQRACYKPLAFLFFH